MKLYTVKNNETGETKGLDLEQTLNLTYFDVIKENIKANPDDFSEDDIKDMLETHDIGAWVDMQNELDQLSEAVTVGRFTITPVGNLD